MSMILDGSNGLTTPGVVNTAGETIATTLSVTGVTTLTGGLNAALPVLSGGTGVTTKTGTGAVVLGTSPTLTTPTFDSASLATISGTAPLYMCRAWVSFNGTGTVAIRASGNVSSVSDNGVGDYTVSFTTAMSDVNYCSEVVWGTGSTRDWGLDIVPGTATTGDLRVFLSNSVSGAGADRAVINVAFFR